jgi:cytochrome c2
MAIFVLCLLSPNTTWADADAGMRLFNGDGKCKNCHKITHKRKVGPGMAGVAKRTSENWIRSWLKDPRSVWTSNDEYTVQLKKYMKKEGKPKPTHKTKPLSDQEISDLLDYLKTL